LSIDIEDKRPKMNINDVSLYRQYSIIDEQGFLEMVATCAYFKFVDRGFVDGYALQDWLDAEKEVTIQCFYWVQDVD
jgi:hypothetical protein